jgi:3-oxoacyl-[acyl-carrier protein] reductase
MDLTGKVALITGASRGIGKACAVKMAELGANIVVNYSSNQVLAEEVVKHICSMGRKAIAIQADVSDQQEVEAMVEETIRILGSLDILINNAGITKDSLLIRMKEQDEPKGYDP